MIYCIDPYADEPIMLINKHIGNDDDTTDEKGNVIKGEGMGIDGALFQSELLQLDTMGKKRIQVWINSPGGVVMDGYSIYSAILKTNTPVDTYAMGGVASIAAVIFQAGRKRIMADYAWLMYHNPFGGNDKVLSTMKESLVKMIEQRSGMSEKQVEYMMNRTTYIIAEEAKTMGLCDQIESSAKANTKYLRTIAEPANFYKECNLVLNSILNGKNGDEPNILNNSKIVDKMENLTKVTMRLRLNDSAPADDIVKAIDAIENRADKAEKDLQAAIMDAQDKAKKDADEMDELKRKLKKAEEDKAKAQADYDDCNAKLSAMEADKKKAEEDAENEKIKNCIEGFAKTGRIKNEATVILKWTNTAKAIGLDEAKAMIESLPLNKMAPTIAEPNKLNEGELPTSAMALAVKNRLKREGKI